MKQIFTMAIGSSVISNCKCQDAHNIANATAAVVTCMDVGLTFDEVAFCAQRIQRHTPPLPASGHCRWDCGLRTIMPIIQRKLQPRWKQRVPCMRRGASSRSSSRIGIRARSFWLRVLRQRFRRADAVYLLDVFPSRRAADRRRFPASSIVDQIDPGKHAQVVNDEYLTSGFISTLEPGDLVLVLGAGSIWKQAPLIVKALEERSAE